MSRVLVVANHSFDRETIRDQLVELGFDPSDIWLTDDGEEAVDLLGAGFDIGLMLVDGGLVRFGRAVCAGPTLIYKIRKKFSSSELPILILSIDPLIISRGQEAGANGAADRYNIAENIERTYYDSLKKERRR